MPREIAYKEPLTTKKPLKQVFAEVDTILKEHPNWIYVVDGDLQAFVVYKR